MATYKLNMLQGIYEDVLKSMAFAVTILLHDAAYQFLRRGFQTGTDLNDDTIGLKPR